MEGRSGEECFRMIDERNCCMHVSENHWHTPITLHTVRLKLVSQCQVASPGVLPRFHFPRTHDGNFEQTRREYREPSIDGSTANVDNNAPTSKVSAAGSRSPSLPAHSWSCVHFRSPTSSYSSFPLPAPCKLLTFLWSTNGEPFFSFLCGGHGLDRLALLTRLYMGRWIWSMRFWYGIHRGS